MQRRRSHDDARGGDVVRLGGCGEEREEKLCEVVVAEMVGCEDGLDALWGEGVF